MNMFKIALSALSAAASPFGAPRALFSGAFQSATSVCLGGNCGSRRIRPHRAQCRA